LFPIYGSTFAAALSRTSASAELETGPRADADRWWSWTAVTDKREAIKVAGLAGSYVLELTSAHRVDIPVNTTVVLGKHLPLQGDMNWNPLMDQYVGLSTSTTRGEERDESGAFGVRVKADDERFLWRTVDMSGRAEESVTGGQIRCR
jgi:hypothetical protein